MVDGNYVNGYRNRLGNDDIVSVVVKLSGRCVSVDGKRSRENKKSNRFVLLS